MAWPVTLLHKNQFVHGKRTGFRAPMREIGGLHWDSIGIMENQMETTL